MGENRFPEDPAHLALVLRGLQIGEEVWRATLADYARLVAGEGPEARLSALARAYARHSPHEAPLPGSAPSCRCAACGAAVGPSLARSPGPLVYGRCPGCAHGMLLGERSAPEAFYQGEGYYRARDERGVGYDGYGGEAAYREAKGARLIERLVGVARPSGEPFSRLLEVGSGFGFTRAAAERQGLRTWGVDINPLARQEAARRYGLDTFVGTLQQALAGGSGVEERSFDGVLYQFVLEHIADPADELRAAAAALRPGGWLGLLVPGMEAAEIDVFRASYRSFRADHLHLFSRRSLDLLLQASGLRMVHFESGCGMHLLRGFLDERELAALYAEGRGPDLFAVARSIT